MRSKRSRRALLMGSALAALPSLCAAQNFTWTTPTNASFSVGPWNPIVPGWGGGTSIGLTFLNNIGAPYTATNDIGAPFALNALTFNASDGRSVILTNGAGNELSFVNNGATLPTINGIFSATATLAGRTNIGTTTTVSGISTLNLTGTMTGLGGFTFTGPNQFVSISGANLNTGTTTINSGTISVANDNAFGSGLSIITGGTLRNPNPGSTLANIVTVNNRVILNGGLNYSAPALADLALAGSISGVGSIVVSGAGSLRLTNATNTFTGGVTFNSGTTAFNSRLIYSGNQGIGTGSANFIGPGKSELIFNGLNSTTIPQVNVQNTATAILAPGMDLSTLNVGTLSGGGTIVLGEFSNDGTVNLIGATNTNTGPMSFFSGVTKFDSTARLGNASTLLFDGGTVLPNFNWTNATPTVLSDYTAISVPANQTATFSSGITLNPTALNDALIKNNTGTLLLQGTTTTRIIVNSGTAMFDNSNGTIRYAGSSPAITINAGALFADASTLAAGNLPANAAVSMNSGQFVLFGPESTGTLSLAANTFNLLKTSGIVRFSALDQKLGAGMIYFSGGNFGPNTSVFYTTAPSGSLLLGENGAAGTPTISILAGSIVSEFPGVRNFAAYDPVKGVRPLASSEYASTIVSGSSTLNNVSPGSSQTLSAPTTINSLNSNSLTPPVISGATSLTVDSGLINGVDVSVATLSFTRPATICISTISSVITGSSIMLESVTLTGSNQYTGATIVADGTLTDGASEVIPDTSVVYVNNGFGTPATWNVNGNTETVAGISQQNVVNSGAKLGTIQLGTGTLIVGSGNVSSSFAGNISGSGHLVKTGTGTLSLSGKSNSFSSGLIIRQGMVMAEAMPVASSPTGNPSEFAGMVRDTVSGDAVLGTGSIFLMSAPGNSAELRLGRGVTDLSRPIVVGTANGAGTCILSSDIDPNHSTPTAAGPNITSPISNLNSSLQLSLSSGTLSGLISGGGSIVVNSNPVAGEDPLPIVTISNTVNNTYTGTTSVINGSLYLNPAIGAGTPLGNTTSAINLGSSATTGYVELSLLTDGGNFPRGINVTPGQPGSTLALTGRPRGANNTNIFSGSVTLGATSLRIFSAPNPGFGGSAGTVNFAGSFNGIGSLMVGGGVSTSTVWLESGSSNFTGSTTLTDGTLALGANSTPTTGTPTAGPIGIGSLVVAGATLPPTLIGLANGATLANPLALNSDVNFAGSGLTFTNSVTYSGERTLTVNSFNVTFAGPVSGNGFLNKDGTGALLITSSNTFSTGISVFAGSLQFGASQTMPVLNIGGTAKAVINTGGNKVLRTNALNIATVGVLDLTDEDAILDYSGTSPLPRIAQLIARGYSGGSWNGTGITSSRAQAIANTTIPNKTAVGFAEASTLGIGSFDGQSVDGSAILMRYTFVGDANLDGLVNALDFNAVASNFGANNRTWATGDFTFDNQVNTLDFNWIAINFNQPPLPSGALGALVPEPCCLTLPIVLLLGGRVRRRI